MAGDMSGSSAALREYADAELLPSDRNDIFAEENAENILERMNKMAAEEDQTSSSTATAISQQWEKDSRKDPEEEYFRLSCLALKIIYNEQDTDFVFTVSLFRALYDEVGIGGTGQVVSEMQEVEDPVPSVVQLDRERASEGQRDAKEGSSSGVASQINHRETLKCYLPDQQHQVKHAEVMKVSGQKYLNLLLILFEEKSGTY